MRAAMPSTSSSNGIPRAGSTAQKTSPCHSRTASSGRRTEATSKPSADCMSGADFSWPSSA